MAEPRVDRSFSEPNIRLECQCGWEGHDDDITEWEVQQERDRVVRKCPSCGISVPEWGVLRPIEGAERIARGSLRKSLAEAGYDAS